MSDDEDNNIIVSLEDARELRARKQKELQYYLDHLYELQTKISWLEADLRLTETIIKIIEDESVVKLPKFDDD
jgi:hypothetical protein